VTGASAGIGRATALAFAEAGFDVALLARGRAGLDAAAADVRARGRQALPIPTDVADEDQVFAAAQRVEEELGEIDVWVNDAMTTAFAPTWDVAPEDFRRAVEVTFLGQVWGTLAALKYMRERDRGTIINIGSALAFIGIPLQSAYCASKFACRGFFESVRAELLHERSHVRMGMVHMPAVNTPQFNWCLTTMSHHPQPVPPIYEPEKVARHVVKAALVGRPSTIVGSWNRLVVAAGRFTPAFGNHYAALGAWESQLTSQPISADRPVNLREPVDEHEDAGAEGIFSDKAGGFLDPSFLRSLPTTMLTFARAAAGYGREKVGLWRRGEPARLVGAVAETATGLWDSRTSRSSRASR
ncbi:MAG TPA: SDR family oxidoreductase, partial [Propionibacteriaceae bacterium]|nr:SDR family oxidoreductase [Propionibacteriaceae bacterium]